jgi:hypothetical protein
LTIHQSDKPDAAPLVTNRLDAHIEKLLVKDRAGRFFWAERVERDRQRTLEPVSLQLAGQRLNDAFLAHRPAFPQGYRQYASFGRGRRYPYFDVDNGQSAPTFVSGTLERSIQAALCGVGTLKPRSYLAITSTSPGVPLGYEQAREEASFHVVFGRW